MKEITLKNGVYDLDEISSAVDEHTKIVWICNPNNPTGTYVNERKLTQFIESISENTLIVIDEAYYEYVTAKDFPETLPLREKHNNILVLRTFSSIPLALCVGYAIGQEELIEKLNVVRLPFNVSSLAQKAATIAFNDEAFIEEIVRVNKKDYNNTKVFVQKMKFHFIRRKRTLSSCR